MLCEACSSLFHIQHMLDLMVVLSFFSLLHILAILSILLENWDNDYTSQHRVQMKKNTSVICSRWFLFGVHKREFTAVRKAAVSY